MCNVTQKIQFGVLPRMFQLKNTIRTRIRSAKKIVINLQLQNKTDDET